MRSYATKKSRRQASVLVCILVCLAIATALVGTMVRTALTARRAMRSQHQLRQTELLLTAGVQRARQQLQATDDYQGETWELPAEVLPCAESAQVQIELTPTAESTSRTVRVTARLSVTTFNALQRSYIFSIDPQ